MLCAVNPPCIAWAKQMLPLARCGMAIAERLGARLLLPGNVYNFGETMPARLTEDTPQRAAGRKGQRLREPKVRNARWLTPRPQG